jgi:predicted O-methyltransferase YrrM
MDTRTPAAAATSGDTDFIRRDELPRLINQAIANFFGLRGPAYDGAHLKQVERIAAAVDTAQFVAAEMAEVPEFPHALALLDGAMRQCRDEGLILEFGVFSGRSINDIASRTTRRVYGFDSFEGLPETWRPDHPQGAFRREPPQVAPNVELVIGWFDQTLPSFLASHPGPITLLHVDCDLYSSTKTIFDACRSRIVPGTVIVFDEYMNYVGWRRHEHKAFMEFVASTGLRYRYIGYVPAHQQVAVVIL